MSAMIYHLDDFRAARGTCRECNARPRSNGHPWCGPCLRALELQLRGHRRRPGVSRCAECGYGIESRSSVGYDVITGDVFHRACALEREIDSVEASEVRT